MQFFRNISFIKETLNENQKLPLLEPEDLLNLSSLHSRIKIIFMNTAIIGIFSSIFLKIFFSRYQINGFNSLGTYLLIPCTVLNYYMIFEYPQYKDGYLRRLGVFLEKPKDEIDVDPKYESKRAELIKKYQRKFYTNSQYWH